MPGPQGLLPGVVLAQLPPTGTPTPQTHVTANFGLTHCPDVWISSSAIAVASPTD